MEKDSKGETKVEVVMSYYEIYNDKVFDLFEPPEKRTPSGLPLRDSGGKTVVVGLTERPCSSLKEFEVMYDQANVNRSTSATKVCDCVRKTSCLDSSGDQCSNHGVEQLNAHSSRSHAILCVKLTITSGDRVRVSTASAIDLAGSEDNRRTDNGKERMVESASINKSLFVLAQCVEAISKKQARIPYRESKMTRILSLGQNQGLTVMILNLAPVRSYHLDTLSSLNFANRTKKIEVREVENEPMFRGPSRVALGTSVKGSSIKRQPLRALTTVINLNIAPPVASSTLKLTETKPTKSFMVYTDRAQNKPHPQQASPKRSPLKRKSGNNFSFTRPPKASRTAIAASEKGAKATQKVSPATIEEMVERKVEQILATRAQNETRVTHEIFQGKENDLNAQLQRRLELLEQKVEGKEGARAEGLSYLLMGKQHQSHGEYRSALKMYQLALSYFPDNKKLVRKIDDMKTKLGNHVAQEVAGKTENKPDRMLPGRRHNQQRQPSRFSTASYDDGDDEEYHASDAESCSEDEGFDIRRQRMQSTRSSARSGCEINVHNVSSAVTGAVNSPRTARILSVINSRNVSQIKLLRGVGSKKAEAIVDCLCEMDNPGNGSESGNFVQIRNLAELGKMKGVGLKMVENMRNAIDVA